MDDMDDVASCGPSLAVFGSAATGALPARRRIRRSRTRSSRRRAFAWREGEVMNERTQLAAGIPLPRERSLALGEALPALLHRIAAGEQTALAELYELTVAKLFRLALLIVRDGQDAEEIVCDTFVQIWRNAGQYDPARGSALAWLVTICRSRAVDRRRRNRGELPAGSPHQEACADAAHELSCEDFLQELEQDSAIYRAVSRLPPLRWRLISLAFFQGLTHEEISRKTSLPMGTVKSHIRRALAAMRSELESGIDGAHGR